MHFPQIRHPLWPVLLLIVGLSVSLQISSRFKDPHPDKGDSPAYLVAAYNIAHHGFFSEHPEATAPGIGREPAYALLLAVLMRAPTNLKQFEPSCLVSSQACPTSIYRAAVWGNLVLAFGAALLLGLTALRLTGSAWAGTLATLYICLNPDALSWRHYIISDYLALLLVALAGLQTAWVAKPHRAVPAWRVVALGMTLAALCLTKAVFVWLLLAVALAAAVATLIGHRPKRALWGVLAVALLPLLVWVLRNWSISGDFRLTDARSGIALSTREVFNHMGPRELAAAFVYWTRGFGDGLARLLFEPSVWMPFRLEEVGGYYDVGQHRYGPWVERVIREQGLSADAAQRFVDGELVRMILQRPLGYLASFPALFWRGIWIDLYVLLGLPALITALFMAWRQQNAVLTLVLAPGIFNLLFYPAVSLNIPRYQITALPALALATAWMAWRIKEPAPARLPKKYLNRVQPESLPAGTLS